MVVPKLGIQGGPDFPQFLSFELLAQLTEILLIYEARKHRV